MKEINFEKGFTRDFSIIIESSWFSAINEIGNNPFNPVNVYYINDGVIEVWECQEAIDWILKTVKDAFVNNPQKIENITNSYLKKLELIKKSIPGEIKFIDLFLSTVKDFAWIYYVVLLIIGTQRVHGISQKKAILMYVIPFGVIVLLSAIGLILIMTLFSNNPELLTSVVKQ